MATVLYITAHPHDHQASYSMAVGKEFIDTYREANPQDEVIHLDLYQMNIPHIDADVFSGWGKLRSGSSLDQLSAAEKKSKVGRLNDWWSNTLQPTNMSLCLQCGTFHFRRRLKPISMPFVLRARRLNIPKTDRSACLAAKKSDPHPSKRRSLQ